MKVGTNVLTFQTVVNVLHGNWCFVVSWKWLFGWHGRVIVV